MKEQNKILTQFLSSVALHQLTVIRDDGFYRHLRFKRPGTNAYYFDIVTWPGYLTVTGDMGTWTFSRITDMFEFFTSEHFGIRESFLINPGYWSEKFEAGACSGRHESPCYEFDAQAFDKGLQEWLSCYLEDCDNEENAAEAREAIRELTGNDFRTENDAYHAINNAYFPGDVSSYDIYESMSSLLTYSHHYLWICYAIVWGIERYNTAKLIDKSMNAFLALRSVETNTGQSPVYVKAEGK